MGDSASGHKISASGWSASDAGGADGAPRRPPRGGARAKRLLIGLSLLQSALVVFLIAQLSDLRSRSRDIAQRLSGIEESSNSLRAAPPAATAGAAAAEDDLRRILKDELALALEHEKRDAGAAPAQTTAAAAPPRDPKQTEALRADIDADFIALSGPGRATAARMSALQEKIAKLPPTERRAALGRLSRAMSEGRIDANY